MSNGHPPVLKTHLSSPVFNTEFWGSQDLALESGGVIIDKDTECVLLVHDPLRQIYTLPRGLEDDLDALTRSPFQFLEAKTGISCARLPLPRLVKQQIIPADKNLAEARAIPAYIASEQTTSAFLVCFGTLWRPVEGSKYPDGLQRITFWFGGCVTPDAHQHLPASSRPHGGTGSAEPPYMFLPMSDALERIKDCDDHAWRALTIFEGLWKALSKDDEHDLSTTTQQSSSA